MDYIHGQKKVLVSVTDGIDTSTAAGEMMANMLLRLPNSNCGQSKNEH